MAIVTYVKYRCTREKCQAEDTVKLFPGEAPPPFINCFKCHSGFQMSKDDMMRNNAGMWPVTEDVRRRN